MHLTFNTGAWKILLGCWRTEDTEPGLPSNLLDGQSLPDESFLLALIERHRVAPLAYLHLRNAALVSDQFKSDLRSRVLVSQVEALKAKRFMLRLHGFMSSRGYGFLFLKGLCVAEKYYGDPGLRSSIDIDLWVEPAGFDEVVKWLRAVGYTSYADQMGFTVRQARYLASMEQGTGFSTQQEDFPGLIELHSLIASNYSDFSYDPVQEKNRQIMFALGEKEFFMMGHEDQFLYLCVHGTEHAWFRLKWLFDLPRMMQQVEFDWEQVRNRSLALHCLEHLEISMLVLDSLLGIPIPVPIGIHLDHQKYSSQLRHIYASIANLKGVNETDLSRWRHLLYSLQFVHGFPRTSFFLHYVTGPGDWKLIRLPDNLFFFYYFLRPFLWLYRRIDGVCIFMANKLIQ